MVEPPSGGFPAALADHSLRARERGFYDLVDPGSFVTRPADLAPADWDLDVEEGDRTWLESRHRVATGLFGHDDDSPLALAQTCARSKVEGCACSSTARASARTRWARR
ncbi:MAG: hypothetical protein M5U14_13835 [Acidimicrobiia bacterium]|nr:hypothetical protein [Acidimicrobiia bacterium]